MNQLRRFFFASPADIGIQKYSVDEIVERMRPEPEAPPKLSLRFARVILELVAEAQSTKDETPNHALQRTGSAGR